MKFEHAAEDSDADLASGAVLHPAPGFPSFPARLALEPFDRARQLCGRDRVGLWDPACGAGELVTTLALLRRQQLSAVRGSDVDPDAVALTRRNLALTTPLGLEQRIGALHRPDGATHSITFYSQPCARARASTSATAPPEAQTARQRCRKSRGRLGSTSSAAQPPLDRYLVVTYGYIS